MKRFVCIFIPAIVVIGISAVVTAVPATVAKNLFYELALRMVDREVAHLSLSADQQKLYESIREEARGAMAQAMADRLAVMDEIVPLLKNPRPDLAGAGALLKARMKQSPARMGAYIDRFSRLYGSLDESRRERMAALIRARMEKERQQYEKDGRRPGEKMREDLVKRATEDLSLTPDQVTALQALFTRMDEEMAPQLEGWKAFGVGLHLRLAQDKNPDLAPYAADLKGRLMSTSEALAPRVIDYSIEFTETLTDAQRRKLADEILEKMATARRWIDRFVY